MVASPAKTSDMARGGAERGLLVLLVALALGHASFLFLQPAPTAFGDETHYGKVVRRDLEEGRASLLAGGLRPGMRPELGSRVLANLARLAPLGTGTSPQGGVDAGQAEDGGGAAGEEEDAPGRRSRAAAAFDRALILRAAPFAIALQLATVALVWLQARLLGLSRRAALVAAALLGGFPWLAFHAQAIWPETLHGFLAALALAALLLHRRRPHAGWCALAGLALGYALLAKSSLTPLAVLAPAFAFAFGPRDRGWRPRVAAALACAGALALSTLPQMEANRRAGFGFGLGANRWWNVELAVRTPERVVGETANDEHGLAKWRLQRELTDAYMRASKDPLAREAAARSRTLVHVREHGLAAVLREQFFELTDLLLARPDLAFYRSPCLEQALGYRARWGSEPPTWIAGLARPARAWWLGLLGLGTAGLALGCLRERAFLLPAMLLASALAVVALAPLKFRFLLPLVPALCLGVGVLVDRVPNRPRAEADSALKAERATH